ncbi:steroid receptor RNA activator 1 [Phaenicophaeus curvirostris]|uniref:steroid receptor RNA activator 1 n=1 Tax=Phaenicophaeus curvirostris TaxID=33595 RepID=UPI0037F09A79
MAGPSVRPGNPERGWNDPPQFSYRLQARGGGSRQTLLTRRPPPPPAGTRPGRPPAAAAAAAPPGPPPRAPGPPPLGSPRPRPRSASPEEDDDDDEGAPPAAAAVVAPLRAALAACRPALQKQVCDDIGRRLTLLEAAWAQGKLSAPVRKSMGVLVRELEQQRWDAADETHRSLMVDHVHEVSQWLVGVKRLIAEARSLPAAETVDGGAGPGPEHPEGTARAAD